MDDLDPLDLQDAIIIRLRADVKMAELVGGRVYDEPPASVVFPYVRLGSESVGSEHIGCFTDDDIALSVECHSRPAAGRAEVKRLAAAVRAALDNADMILESGRHLDWIEHLTTSYSRAADGVSWIAVVAFEAAVADAD